MDAGKKWMQFRISLGSWLAAHERAVAVSVSWILSAVFAAVAVVRFLKSFGLI